MLPTREGTALGEAGDRRGQPDASRGSGQVLVRLTEFADRIAGSSILAVTSNPVGTRAALDFHDSMFSVGVRVAVQ